MNIIEPTAKKTIPARRLSISPLGRLGGLSEGRYRAYFLLVPSLILVVAGIIYPVASGITLIFREMRLNRPDKGTGIVGLRHYVDLAADPVFRVALGNTVIRVAGGEALLSEP
jgi:multiple sugar transport system permease protein